MEQPFLSIAIPTYNRSEKLDFQLNTIHRNLSKFDSSQQIEVIVLDNCSDDKTPIIVNTFMAQERNYIFTLHRNDKNLGSDRNFGMAIQKSSGRFVWILSDDDLIDSSAIAVLFQTLAENKDVGFCFINYFKDHTRENPAVPIDNNYTVSESFTKFTSEVFFSESMISACVFRKSLLKDEDLIRHLGEGYPHMYWAADILQEKSGLIIKKPLFYVIHPGVHASRAAAKKRENTHDFYLEAHLGFLRYISYVLKFNLTLKLRISIYRYSLNENLNQIIYHKITSNTYDLISLKKALPTMLKKFYYSPSFWIFHLPLLILPSFFARFAEPMRWKYLELRHNLGKTLKKVLSVSD